MSLKETEEQIRERQEKCAKELEKVLNKHNCTIGVSGFSIVSK